MPFLGLGNMGKGMAVNLVNKGNSLVVYDVNTEAVSELGFCKNMFDPMNNEFVMQFYFS